MEKLYLALKIIGSSGALTVLILLANGWRNLRDRSLGNKSKISAHDTKLSEQDVKMEDMEKRINDRVDEKFNEVNTKVDEMKNDFKGFVTDNKESHSKLHEEQNKTLAIVSRIDGYLLGQQQANQQKDNKTG